MNLVSSSEESAKDEKNPPEEPVEEKQLKDVGTVPAEAADAAVPPVMYGLQT